MARYLSHYIALNKHCHQGLIFKPRHSFFQLEKVLGRKMSVFPNEENYSVLKEMYKDSNSILEAGIEAVNSRNAIQRHFFSDGNKLFVKDSFQQTKHYFDLSQYEKILILGFGKASSGMALATCDIVRSVWKKKMGGIVIVKDGHVSEEEVSSLRAYNVTTYTASHPVPDHRSVKASDALLDLAKSNSNSSTLIFCCISGGGSSLFCSPKSPLTLFDLKETNKALLGSGMDIKKMNVIRKCLERGKGGGLAEICYPAKLVSFILSDVIGDDLQMIASGPTVPSDTQFIHARKILEEYELDVEGALPSSVTSFLEKDDSSNQISHVNSSNFLVGNNMLAVAAAAKQAELLGYKPYILTTELEGEAKLIGEILVNLASHIKRGMPYSLTSPPAALIAGGETTVTLPSNCNGKGGRNQELCLSAALAMQKQKQNLANVILTSIGTDGNDGPTDAAGASVDADIVRRIEKRNQYLAIEALKKHDAYNFFSVNNDGLGGLIKTKATGTNVADIYFVLIR